MQLSKKQKKVSQLFLHQILNIFKKRMALIVYVFPKLQTANYVARQMSKKSRFRAPIYSQNAKGSQNLLKSA